MSNIFSPEIRNKAKEATQSDWIKVKDGNTLLLTKENPFVGRLTGHEYVDADNPQYGNDEGKKHILTWLTREKGKVVKKRQSTTSWQFIHLLAKGIDKGVQDFRFWFELVQTAGGVRTVPRIELILSEGKSAPVVKPEETPVAEDSEKLPDGSLLEEPPEIDVKDLPF